ncbi:PREDICTED: mitogen-activated protein kinase kinase kinase 1-like [Camelina sativa]|uniref:Mitogen-activated protein kinase kinase kinase 1-like n=1 Tax=Camelina sativa TaxID=90675 RepID=A0ABM0XEZ5_CAMSA|nr:PREDICTED: mitogen-activated protein kinase kinase kinase 1-like [Camelina sativa]
MDRMMREPLRVDESSMKHVCVLGRGSFGCVSLQRDSNFRLYAMKSSSSFNQVKDFHKEVRIMLRLRNHPRIVQALSSFVHLSAPPEEEGCHIYMEYASKGTLYNMISRFRGKPMPENMIRRAALMILQGLHALHSNGYVHCDLKPANVLVFPSTTVGEPWDLKLADFGFSKEPCTDSRSLFHGTEQYMPPESLGPDGEMGSSTVDIWSLGCMVIEMFGGCALNMGDRYMWRLPILVSPVADDFLMRCLALQPSRRATAAELLNHPFLAQQYSTVPILTEMPPYPFLRFPPSIMDNVMEEYARLGLVM